MQKEKLSFVQKFVKWVKGWRLDKWFAGFRNGDIEQGDELAKSTELASMTMQKLKRYLENPIGDIIVAISPTDADNKMLETLRKFISDKANTVSSLVGIKGTPAEILIEYYKKLVLVGDEDSIKGWKTQLGVGLTRIFADGKLTWSDAVIAGQLIYELLTKPQARYGNID